MQIDKGTLRAASAEQAGLGHAPGDDESELHDVAGTVVAGFVLVSDRVH